MTDGEGCGGVDGKSSKAVWGKEQNKQRWEKLEETEAEDNQLVRDGITTPTVMGMDRIEKSEKGGDGDIECQKINRSGDGRLRKTNKKTKSKSQMQRYSKIKSAMLPAGNASDWKYSLFSLFFF